MAKENARLKASMAMVTAKSQNWNRWETGISSSLTLRNGFLHSFAQIFSATDEAAMPKPVNTIIGGAQILTT